MVKDLGKEFNDSSKDLVTVACVNNQKHVSPSKSTHCHLPIVNDVALHQQH